MIGFDVGRRRAGRRERALPPIVFDGVSALSPPDRLRCGAPAMVGAGVAGRWPSRTVPTVRVMMRAR